ncbi:hypothetical protein NE237_021879 [Protea cynaroides]|uniref:Purple acid phosphatase n=1 Tax=Protea cynaroides TaxID=273540 RepID=A0A9Q0K307_9MAGN|nr:hypothetical protein NE237_021879 [Protea cynaroides]
MDWKGRRLGDSHDGRRLIVVGGRGRRLGDSHDGRRLIVKMGIMRITGLLLLVILLGLVSYGVESGNHQPLARIAIHKARIALEESALVTASPTLLGLGTILGSEISSGSTCPATNSRILPPLLCSAPIKYQYANYSTADYSKTGNGTLSFLLINQRADFAFALFSGGISNPKLIAMSNTIAFAYPNAPLYPRLAQGKIWNEMTVTWTSGYGLNESEPFVEWGRQGETQIRSPAVTLTFTRESLCGPPATTVGWRDPGFIHTTFMKELWPNAMYTYKLGHKLINGSYVWSPMYSFKASPYPGQDSLQRVIIFGDMGKGEADGSNEYYPQPGSLNTTKQLINDLNNYDIVIHNGDITYADGYLSQWDQFTAQVEPIASTKPYMITSGNHERDWPNTGSFYTNTDSGGECGVLAETMFYVPTTNKDNFWYSTDYGMFHFCIADTEHDWRPGTPQYLFLENCFASVDRQRQPWLIFIAHRVLGYSSSSFYFSQGTSEEPMGRDSLQQLWQKYKVDLGFYGHVHNYERTCPVYESICTMTETKFFQGSLNGMIHIVAGGAGQSLSTFAAINTTWSVYKDYDWGFVKLTAFNHTTMLFEYKKSRDGLVYDSFTIQRNYSSMVACTFDSCPSTTLAS